MSITIYASDRTTQKYTLNAIQTSRLHQSLNGECTFDFSMPGRLIPGIAIGDEVRLGDLYFSVVRIAKQTGVAGVSFGVSCEHISYQLADTLQTAAHFSGTVGAVLAEILSGTGFSVGTVEITGTFSVTINNDTNKRSALQEWAAVTGAELSYTGRAINFVTRVGSSTPRVLSDVENVASLGVTLDSRSDTQSYSVTLSRLQTLGLGDAVTIRYTSLNLDTTARVITLDYDPFHPWTINMVTGDHIPDFTGAVTSALEARIKEGQPYFGVTIDRENGIQITRSDGASEALFNSDTFAMRALIDGVMRDRIYFDPIKGDYVFDGALGADAVFTDSLYAETGDVAELTVDRLSTSRRIRKYILQDTSDDNYILAQDQYLRFITGTPSALATLLTETWEPLLTEGGEQLLAESNTYSVVQARNRYGELLYWQREPVSHTSDGYPLDDDGVQIYASTNATDWPVYMYSYTEQVKAEFAFNLEDGVYVPQIVLGAGDENGRTIGRIHKGPDGLDFAFTTSAGDEVGFQALSAGFLDLLGLRKPTELDFSDWDNGRFSETLDGGMEATFDIDFDAQDRPIKFTDGDGHETAVIWDAV